MASILGRIPRVPRNARFKLINFYILHRGYLTPERIQRYIQVMDAAYPRCGEVGANVLYMLRSCHCLRPLWEEVMEVLETVLRKEVSCMPGHCLLGWYPHTPKQGPQVDFKT
ncbi:hypothetical protein NDU88_006497 [Pleurodeles waltl]|uniref:Uncharacterized protein n=1 Tax=Pleurodeles waltl TaxID=8319 RepID=A0AAV7WEP2_PLEWA|nr:hypothetical protein NDU88_006497 [Pleurodeles waltl]